MVFRSIGISFCWASVLMGFRSTEPKPTVSLNSCLLKMDIFITFLLGGQLVELQCFSGSLSVDK